MNSGDVNCALVPPRFHYNTLGQCSIEDPKDMRYGTTQAVGPDTKVDPVTLAKMFTHLDGVDAGLLPRGDYDGFCQGLLVHLHRGDQICDGSFPLFDKYTAADDTDFLGYVTVICSATGGSSSRGIAAVLDMCSMPCMDDPTKVCCRVPALVSLYFGCCSAFKCCLSQLEITQADSRSHIPGGPNCVDAYPTCPRLKKEFDDAGYDCFNTDVGKVTNVSTNAGVYLVDKCCKTCHPCEQKCYDCMKFGSVTQCSGVLNRDCSPCGRHRRRRTQGMTGNVAAHNVKGHMQSKLKLQKLIGCLKKSDMVPPAGASHHHRRLGSGDGREPTSASNTIHCAAGASCGLCPGLLSLFFFFSREF